MSKNEQGQTLDILDHIDVHSQVLPRIGEEVLRALASLALVAFVSAPGLVFYEVYLVPAYSLPAGLSVLSLMGFAGILSAKAVAMSRQIEDEGEDPREELNDKQAGFAAALSLTFYSTVVILSPIAAVLSTAYVPAGFPLAVAALYPIADAWLSKHFLSPGAIASLLFVAAALVMFFAGRYASIFTGRTLRRIIRQTRDKDSKTFGAVVETGPGPRVSEFMVRSR